MADERAMPEQVSDLGAGAPRLILASASPRRLDVLRQLGLEPEVRPADLDESYLPGEAPAEHVERLARAKAEAVAAGVLGAEGEGGPERERGPEREGRSAASRGAPAGEGGGPLIVIGGDTVVVADDRVLAKPVDAADAVRMLLSLSGGAHEVLSGLALAQPDGAQASHAAGDSAPDYAPRVGRSPATVSAISRTVVRMRSFDEETARRYVGTGEPMDKAGAYGIQGQGAALVEGIEGDYYSVVGFPVGAFLDLLERAGWRFAFGRLTGT